MFARYCDKVMERFADRIAYAVTLNEPNLAHLLEWFGLPDFIGALNRATLAAASEATGVSAYRLANVALPEEMDALEDGMAAGHVAARTVIKARRPDLPVEVVDRETFLRTPKPRVAGYAGVARANAVPA